MKLDVNNISVLKLIVKKIYEVLGASMERSFSPEVADLNGR